MINLPKQSRTLILFLLFAACSETGFKGNSAQQPPASSVQPTATTTETTDKYRSQVDDHQIVFGADTLFHIGDGNYKPNTNCAAKLDSIDLSGVVFKFSFDLLAKDTIDVVIGTLCGIDDYENSVHLKNLKNGIVEKRLGLDPTMKSFSFEAKDLEAGSYVIEVISPLDETDGQLDHDDFAVGRLSVKSTSAKIVIKEIKTE